MTINPVLRERLAYDPVRDFAPVTLISRVPLVLVVAPALDVGTLRELVALAQRKPRELHYGSASSTFLFATELFAHRAGIALSHVPYNGGPPSCRRCSPATCRSRSSTCPRWQAHLASAAARALAVTGTTRDTLAAGRADARRGRRRRATISASGSGLFAPAANAAGDDRAPQRGDRGRARVARRARPAARGGITPVASTPEALAELVRQERLSIEAVARSATSTAKWTRP
jgi:hypothetical protein